MYATATTLPGCLAEHADATPERVALREKADGIWRELTWAAYRDEVAAAARALIDLGVQPGDHVAILSDNRTEWLFADLGAQAIGARSVGIYQTNPAEDVAYVLAHCEAPVLLCEDQEQVDKAIACAADTPGVRTVAVFDPRGLRHYDDPRVVRWSDLVAAARSALEDEDGGPATFLHRQLSERDPHAPAMVVYTSGTTGPPKGALLTPDNALAVGREVVPVLGITRHDQLLSYLPLCHVAEKIFSQFIPLAAGSVVHFGEAIDTVQHDLREVSPTVFLGVPRIWEKMHASVELRMRDSTWLKRALYQRFVGANLRRLAEGQPATWLDRVRSWLGDVLVFRPLQEHLGLRRCALPVSGAAPIPIEVLRWLRAVGVPVVEGYGMTESAGVSHINRPDDIRIGTVGRSVPTTECRIADDGEILLRGPHIFAGYLHDPEATARTVDADGWLHTGDVGVLQGDHLSITGRKKEILITAGGKNLSPEKIENALKASPYIKEAVSIGDGRRFVAALVQIDSEAVGDWAMREGVAFTDFEDLTRKPGVVALVQQAVDEANARLARVEQVRAFRLFPRELHQDEGELTPTQKVRRRAVAERWSDLIEEMYR